MFTGIIEDLGTIKRIEKRSGLSYLQVKSKIFLSEKVGNSISVNGVCLTITAIKTDAAGFDIMAETVKKSILDYLKLTDKVNLERALKVGDRLGGHFVTGHVDCTGRIVEKRKVPGDYYVRVEIPRENMKFIVQKGSIALDGISLTIAKAETTTFTVHLIPHTIKTTTLGLKDVGNRINIEFDLLGKYVLNSREKVGVISPINENFLKKKGFVRS